MTEEQLKIFVVGTNHRFQLGEWSEVLTDADDVRQFQDFLKTVCKLHSIQMFAEEASRETLKIRTKTAVQEVATELGFPTVLCDPTVAERTALGLISDPSYFKITMRWKDMSEADIDAAIAASDRTRESLWLDAIRIESPVGTILFICGADHVSQFVSLLNSSEIAVQVLSEDWIPIES